MGSCSPAELPGMFPAAHNAVFCVFIGCLYIRFREMSFAPEKIWIIYFSLLLRSKSYLYIPDTSPRPEIRFINMFSHSVSCLFTFSCPLMCKSFPFVQIVCFSSVPCAFDVAFKETLAWSELKTQPVFSCKTSVDFQVPVRLRQFFHR